MSAHVVLHPRERGGLTHVIARDDEIDGEVLDANSDFVLIEQDADADGEDADAEDAETVAVAELVGAERGDDAKGCCDDCVKVRMRYSYRAMGLDVVNVLNIGTARTCAPIGPYPISFRMVGVKNCPRSARIA